MFKSQAVLFLYVKKNVLRAIILTWERGKHHLLYLHLLWDIFDLSLGKVRVRTIRLQNWKEDKNASSTLLYFCSANSHASIFVVTY